MEKNNQGGKNKFDGETYHAKHDEERLSSCFDYVKDILECGHWMTLSEIQQQVVDEWGNYYSLTTISARIRDLRKDKFGGNTVERRRRGDPSSGLFEYKLIRE